MKFVSGKWQVSYPQPFRPSGMALTTDDLNDMRGTPFGPSQATMDRILTRGGGNIFQGGVLAAHDLVRLRKEHLGYVINCTTNTPLPPWAGEPATPTLDVMAVCGEEVRSAMRSTGIVHLLDTLLDRIQHLLTSNVSVMIHCRAGVHRAGARGVILAMHFLNLNPRDALAHVRARRRLTNVEGDNWQVVLRYAEEMESRRSLPRAPAAADPGPPSSAAPAAEGAQATPANPADPEDPAEPTVLAEASWLVSLSESELEDDARDDPWVRVEPPSTSLNPPPPLVCQTKAFSGSATSGPPPSGCCRCRCAATSGSATSGPPPSGCCRCRCAAGGSSTSVSPSSSPSRCRSASTSGSFSWRMQLPRRIPDIRSRSSVSKRYHHFKDWHSGSSSGWQQ